MKIWLDAQLSPALAKWMSHEMNMEAVAVRDLVKNALTHDEHVSSLASTLRQAQVVP